MTDQTLKAIQERRNRFAQIVEYAYSGAEQLITVDSLPPDPQPKPKIRFTDRLLKRRRKWATPTT